MMRFVYIMRLISISKKKLHLTINEKKSGIYPVLDRIFLGYKFYKYNGKYEGEKI